MTECKGIFILEVVFAGEIFLKSGTVNIQYLCEPEHVDHEAMQGGIIFDNLNALSLGNFV